MAAPKGMNICRSQGDFCLSEGQMDKQKIPGLYRTLSPLEPLPERSDEEVKDDEEKGGEKEGGRLTMWEREKAIISVKGNKKEQIYYILVKDMSTICKFVELSKHEKHTSSLLYEMFRRPTDAIIFYNGIACAQLKKTIKKEIIHQRQHEHVQ